MGCQLRLMPLIFKMLSINFSAKIVEQFGNLQNDRLRFFSLFASMIFYFMKKNESPRDSLSIWRKMEVQRVSFFHETDILLR